MYHSLLLLFVVTVVTAERAGMLLPDGSILHFESVKNDQDNTEILTFGARTVPGHLNGIKFHDFNTGYIASKLVDQGVCLLFGMKHWTPTYISPKLVKYPPVVNYTITPIPMETSDIIGLAGLKIATFCNDYNTHLLLESTGRSTTTKRDFVTQELMDDCKCQGNRMENMDLAAALPDGRVRYPDENP